MSSLGILRTASLFGALLSGYALYVEYQKDIDIGYDALCDVNSYITCSKVFTSEYGHILEQTGLVETDSPLNLPNAAFGLLFYMAAFFHDSLPLSFKYRTQLMVLGAVASTAFSAYLAYVLAVILQDFCIVCASMYVVNILILVASIKRSCNAAPASEKLKAV